MSRLCKKIEILNMSGNGKWKIPGEIKERRRELGLRQIDCAELAHVNRSTWQKWESGNKPLSPFAFIKIDMILGDGTIRLTSRETRKIMNVIIRCGIYIDDLTSDQKREFKEVINMLNEKLGNFE